MEEFKQKHHDLMAEIKRDLDQKGAISSESAAKAISVTRSQIEKMATLDGKEDKTMRALAEVLAERQEETAPYAALVKHIETARPMDMSTVKDKADLATRRKLGEELLRLNGEMMTLTNSTGPRLREKLKQYGETGRRGEELVMGFMKGEARSISLLLRVRKSDETLAKSLIAATILMETEWGKWKAQDGTIVFEDGTATKRYSDLVDAIEKASDEQAAAQRELFELQQRK